MVWPVGMSTIRETSVLARISYLVFLFSCRFSLILSLAAVLISFCPHLCLIPVIMFNIPFPFSPSSCKAYAGLQLLLKTPCWEAVNQSCLGAFASKLERKGRQGGMVWHAYAPFPPPISTLTIISASFLFLSLIHPPRSHLVWFWLLINMQALKILQNVWNIPPFKEWELRYEQEVVVVVGGGGQNVHYSE